MSVDDVVDGYSYWTFSDLSEENYFPSVPFHGGFVMMNLYGVPKPIYRAFHDREPPQRPDLVADASLRTADARPADRRLPGGWLDDAPE